MVPVLDVNGMPTTHTSGPNIGRNVYVNLTHLKTYNYATLTTKFQFDKLFGLGIPVYASCFFTNNSISGEARDATQSNIPNMFDQTVYDIAGMFQPIRNVNLMVDYGKETWRSQHTYPQVGRNWTTLGAGLAYDIPWGGSRMEFRYKHVIFRDDFVPLNNYEGDQVFSMVSVLF
jgi:hypothetical protein